MNTPKSAEEIKRLVVSFIPKWLNKIISKHKANIDSKYTNIFFAINIFYTLSDDLKIIFPLFPEER